jgi:hypothetical protein
MAVDRLRSLVGEIRSEIARKTERSRRDGVTRGQSRGGGERLSLEELRSGLRSGFLGLDLHDASHKRQARHAFLELVLLAEFGVSLANDPRFLELVSGVESAFCDSPDLCAELDQVVSELAHGG